MSGDGVGGMGWEMRWGLEVRGPWMGFEGWECGGA